MKDILLKSLFILPIIAFVDYLIMIAVGCTCSLFGSNNSFYEGTFCTIAKVVFLVSVVGFLFVVTADIFSLLKKRKQLN